MRITKGPMEPWDLDDNYLTTDVNNDNLTHETVYFDFEECDEVHPDRKSTNDLIKISEDEKTDIISPYIENNNKLKILKIEDAKKKKEKN